MILLCAALCPADSITGMVHDRTTGKPAAGDEVVLLRLGEGMQEQSRTNTDAQGGFVLEGTEGSAEYIVRVLHQRVNYDQPATGRTSQLQIEVYDAVDKIPGLSGKMGIVQTESDGRFLKLTEMYAIDNASQPPVTQASPRNLTISLPPKATLDWAQVKGPGGIWTKAPLAEAKDGKFSYTIDFPLRPGETLFKFSYHLPYQGPTSFHLKVEYPIQKFAVVHPSSMSFKAARPNTFANPGLAGGMELEQVLAEPVTGQIPAFTIAGQGVAPPVTSAGKEPRSGGQSLPALPTPQTPALTARISAPTPPASSSDTKQIGLMAGGLAGILAAGIAVWLLTRKRRLPASPKQPQLEALKDELFQLESDRLHGSISAEEYASSKDALNAGIQRALARNKN